MPVRVEPNQEPIPGYKLIDRLGQGGFGEVWKAEAPGGIHKAVKLVHGRITGPGQEDNTLLDRELKGLSRIREIRHPFILSLERYEVVDGRLIIVMELAEYDLVARLQQCKKQGLRGIPRDELLKYMSEAAEALDLMNFEYGIQHLDIKPSNLFVSQKHVKVADFGLAKDLEGFSAEVTSGMTPIYAAPETFNGMATRNTDQYSLAIVYQELLTDILPYPGPSAQQFMLQHLTKEPNLQPLPAHDEPVLRKALAKDPNSRFGSCMEFVRRLIEAGDESDPRKQSGASGARPKTTVLPGATPTEARIEGRVIGIDLGTSNSVVAIAEGRNVQVLADEDGRRLTPSVVAFTANGRLVGVPAKRQATTNPIGTIFSVKRLIGRRYKEVEQELASLAYKAVPADNDGLKVVGGDKEFAPQEISAFVLRRLRDIAETYLGETVTKAVITVPAYFNDSQRQATKDAGQIAGLEVLRIVNEPTAAALAYGFNKGKNARIAVFDLGGGTFDITILHVRDGIFDVLSTNGDTRLGGDDFDRKLVDYIAEDFEKQHGFDLRREPMALGRVYEAAEKAKIELSDKTQTEIHLPYLASGKNGPCHVQLMLTRPKFESLIKELVDRCRQPCLQALEDARLKPSDVDEVVLVGGSTRIPMVVSLAKLIFGKEPSVNVNPDEAIAFGAAIQAGILKGDFDDLLLLDVTPLSLGLESKGGMMYRLIDRNTTVPTVKKETFSTARDGQTEVGVHILQGEREFAGDNRSLGKFWLTGIRPAPAGVPRIEITFSLDANGILDVSAKDLDTSNEQAVRVESSGGLTKSEIIRMQKESDEMATDDKSRKELIEAKVKAQVVLADADKRIKKGQLSDTERKSIERSIERLQESLASGNLDRIVTTIWQLQQAIRPPAKVGA